MLVPYGYGRTAVSGYSILAMVGWVGLGGLTLN